MEIIAEVEEEQEEVKEEITEEQDGEKVHHSFWPQPWPNNVSQVAPTRGQRRRMEDALTAGDRRRAIPRAQRYLPCHYFDYICGSSTGA